MAAFEQWKADFCAAHNVSTDEQQRFKFRFLEISEVFITGNSAEIWRIAQRLLNDINTERYRRIQDGQTDIPPIADLKEMFLLPPNIDLETIIRARWMSRDPAPNGQREHLAWILILIDMLKQKEDSAS